MLEARESRAGAQAPGAAADGLSRFVRAALLGSAIALALDLWMLAGPHFTLLWDRGMLGSFFDVQGRALLDGHLDVDPSKVGFEGFRVDGRTYIYFGLVPSLLRLPVLAVTHGLDARLTQLSMLLGLLALAVGTASLHWRVREWVRPGAPFGRSDAWATALLQLAVLAGGIPLYLASRPVVYHEAELWGAALAVAALAAIVAVLQRPTSRRIVWAGVFATLALNTRFSVGLGPVLALGLVTVGFAAGLWSARRPGRVARLLSSLGPEPRTGAGPRRLVLLVGATVVPVVLSAAVNVAKFDSPFGIPIEKQVASQVEPDRRAALDANGGTIFGLKFAPTAVVQAVRPDAVGRLRAFPFVGLPSRPAHVFGDLRFDTIQPSLSATTSMPALFLLTLVGGVAALLRRRLRPLLAMLIAAAGGFAVTVTIAFITTRYLADLLPFLVLGGVIGLQVLLGLGKGRRWVLAAVGGLALVGFVTNGSSGLTGQRLFYPETKDTERAAFVRTQADIDDTLGRDPRGIFTGPNLPVSAPGNPGDLFLLDGCAGVYVEGLAREWLPVERGERSGLHRLDVRFSAGGEVRPAALLTLGSGRRRVAVTTSRGARGTVFALRVGDRTVASSRPVSVPTSRPVRVVVSIDPLYGNLRFGRWYATVFVDGEQVVTGRTPFDRLARVALGAGSGGLRPFSGSVERIAAAPVTCRAVTAGLASASPGSG